MSSPPLARAAWGRCGTGDSAASIIPAIMEREPARLELGPPLERVLRTWLEKDPERRNAPSDNHRSFQNPNANRINSLASPLTRHALSRLLLSTWETLRMKHYDDSDNDQFLHPNRNPDLHWTFLPASEIANQAAANPPRQKILRSSSSRPTPTPPTEDDRVPRLCRRRQQSHRRAPRLAKSPALTNRRIAKQPQRSHSN